MLNKAALPATVLLKHISNEIETLLSSILSSHCRVSETKTHKKTFGTRGDQPTCLLQSDLMSAFIKQSTEGESEECLKCMFTVRIISESRQRQEKSCSGTQTVNNQSMWVRVFRLQLRHVWYKLQKWVSTVYEVDLWMNLLICMWINKKKKDAPSASLIKLCTDCCGF